MAEKRAGAPPLVSPKLVSIVIPIFNRAATIGRAIESCLAQTCERYEILLVDDGSSDDLDTALRPFLDGDPRIRLVRHAANQGVSAARNTGVREAKGDLIAFLDSDDAWHPTKLETQLAAVASLEGDRYLCGTLTEVIAGDEFMRLTPTRRLPPDIALGDYMFVRKVRKRLPAVTDPRAAKADGYFVHLSSALLPKTLAAETPFRPSLTQYEDLAFLIDLGRKGTTFVVIEEPLAIQHDDVRPGRLGHRDDIARGRLFLDAMGEALSPDARLAFETSHLAHLHAKERPLHTIRTVFDAFRRGLIGLRTVLGIFFRSVFGQGNHRTLRDAVGRLRFRREVLPG